MQENSVFLYTEFPLHFYVAYDLFRWYTSTIFRYLFCIVVPSYSDIFVNRWLIHDQKAVIYGDEDIYHCITNQMVQNEIEVDGSPFSSSTELSWSFTRFMRENMIWHIYCRSMYFPYTKLDYKPLQDRSPLVDLWDFIWRRLPSWLRSKTKLPINEVLWFTLHVALILQACIPTQTKRSITVLLRGFTRRKYEDK